MENVIIQMKTTRNSGSQELVSWKKKTNFNTSFDEQLKLFADIECNDFLETGLHSIKTDIQK